MSFNAIFPDVFNTFFGVCASFFVVLLMNMFLNFFSIHGKGLALVKSQSLYGLKATQASCPPNPRESEIPIVRSVLTALLGV